MTRQFAPSRRLAPFVCLFTLALGGCPDDQATDGGTDAGVTDLAADTLGNQTDSQTAPDTGVEDVVTEDASVNDTGAVDLADDTSIADLGPEDTGVDGGSTSDLGDDAGQSDMGNTDMPPLTEPLRFAVIGDFGTASEQAFAVAALVKAWEPEFIVTVGDNNYPDGEASTIDEVIGQLYHAFIRPYVGIYGEGAPDRNRFFPTLGNHDWNTAGALPYREYFDLPNNERYYDFVWGPVHFFMIDSDGSEPDGTRWDSGQAAWFEERMAASTTPFQFALFHHPPYSSGHHGSDGDMQWPFAENGVDLVLNGHEHNYERLTVAGLPYVITGHSGQSLRTIDDLVGGSRIRYEETHGAVLAEVTDTYAEFWSVDLNGGLIDHFVLRPEGGFARGGTDLVATGATWRFLDGGETPGDGWTTEGFDDGAWGQAAAPLGYGDGQPGQVSYGDDSSNKPVTTYFRHRFNVTDPALFRDIALSVRRDDGALVFLNEVEVLRSNLPAGTILADTLAVDTIGGGEEDAFHEVVLSADMLDVGWNVLAVEVHQAAVDSSDITLDAGLFAVFAEALVPFGSEWSYRDTREAPSGDWTSLDFNDSDWSGVGAAPLGYGNGDEATTLSYGANAEDKHITAWFRHEFQVTDAASYSYLLLSLVRDDGGIVYLNGVEVHAINLPGGPVTPQTTAYYAIGGEEESSFHETVVDGALLVEGTNILAVEIHQAAIDSSDLRFDLELGILD